MGVLRVYDIPQPRSPKFNREINEKTGMKMDIQTGIKSPTAIDYYNDGNDRWVIVGNENNDISIIDLNKKIEDNAEDRHSESVLTIKLDGNHMITASESGEVFTWDVDGEKCVNKFANDFRCNSISFNADESKLVLAGVKVDDKGNKINKIATCDINDGMWGAIEKPKGEDGKEKLIELDVHEDKSGMGEVIEITQNSSGLVFIEENKLTIGNDDFELKEIATVVDASLDSTDAFVGFKDGNIVRYPSQNSFETKVNCPVTKIKIFGERLIAGYKDGSVNIFDLSGNYLDSLEGHDKAINNIYVDDSQIITVSKDNTLKIWENNECKYTYYLDIYATSVNIKGDKVIVRDTLGNVRFFSFEN
jgi:WD40 repeat protein